MQNAHAMDSSGNVSFKWIKAFSKCGDGGKAGLIVGSGVGEGRGKGSSILPGSLLEEFLPSPGSLSFVSFSSSSAAGVGLSGPSASSLGSSVQKGRLVSRIGTPPHQMHAPIITWPFTALVTSESPADTPSQKRSYIYSKPQNLMMVPVQMFISSNFLYIHWEHGPALKEKKSFSAQVKAGKLETRVWGSSVIIEASKPHGPCSTDLGRWQNKPNS